MNTADIAEERFKQQYSCSQSVFSALADDFGVDSNLSLKIGAGFGGGIARSAQPCGCITGGIMAIGLAQPSVSPEANHTEKEKTYEKVQRFMRAFEDRYGSQVCRNLLGCDISTPEGMQQAKAFWRIPPDQSPSVDRCRGWHRRSTTKKRANG